MTLEGATCNPLASGNEHYARLERLMSPLL